MLACCCGHEHSCEELCLRRFVIRDRHGYVAPGIQCEGISTEYWLSTPDVTGFSGAVIKVKGDDDDTCHALTNGQVAYGIYDLVDSFGTSDFDRIRRTHFPTLVSPRGIG